MPAPEPTATIPPPTPSPTVAPTPRPTQAPPVTSLPQPTPEPGELVLWAAVTEAQQEPLRQLIEQVSKMLEIEVQLTTKSTDALQADLHAALIADLPLPDLVWGTQDDLGILARQGLIQPAKDDLAADQFILATISGATLDNQRWGTPLAAQGALYLLYNRKLVGEAPQTTDALIVAARNQTTGNRFGLVAAWAEPRWLAAWLNGAGGTTLGGDGQPTLNTEEMIAALNLLKELRRTGPPPPSTYADGVKLFREGRAAFAIDGDWAIESYRQYTDTLDLGIAPMPLFSATGRAAAAPLNGIYLMYNADLAGVQLERAYALANALTQPEVQVQIARDLALLPALRAALADPALHDIPTIVAARVENATGLPPTQALRCAWSAISILLPPVLLGEVDQEDAGRLMQDRANNCIATP